MGHNEETAELASKELLQSWEQTSPDGCMTPLDAAPKLSPSSVRHSTTLLFMGVLFFLEIVVGIGI